MAEPVRTWLTNLPLSEQEELFASAKRFDKIISRLRELKKTNKWDFTEEVGRLPTNSVEEALRMPLTAADFHTPWVWTAGPTTAAEYTRPLFELARSAGYKWKPPGSHSNEWDYIVKGYFELVEAAYQAASCLAGALGGNRSSRWYLQYRLEEAEKAASSLEAKNYIHPLD